MDAASVQEILAAIRAVIASNATATTAAAQAATAATDAANAATNAVTAHAGGGGGATVNTDTSPYSGNALDLGSKIGSTLYFQASKPLGTLFTSKPETFFLFLQDLTERVEECQWNSSTHNILTISKGNPAVTYDIIGDYGRLTLQDVNTAREAREAGTDDRAKQNARQLYICLYASCDELTKSRMLSNDLKRDGPTLLIHMLKSTFTANFQHAQATRLELQKMHPKTFGYDLPKIHASLKLKFEMIRAGSTKQDPLNFESEFYHYVFAVYALIKSPQEFVHFIYTIRMESDRSATPMPLSEVMLRTEIKQKELEHRLAWKPDDQNPEDRLRTNIVAMLGTHNPDPGGAPKGKTNRTPNSSKQNTDGKWTERDNPPFIEEPGKPGDTKDWEGKTWHYCTGQHRYRWVIHSPEKCKKPASGSGAHAQLASNGAAPPGASDQPAQVKLDRASVMQAMQAVNQSGINDEEEAAAAFLSFLEADG